MSGIALGRRTTEELEARLAAASQAPLTYRHVGSTLGDAPPGVTDRVFTRDLDGSLAAAGATLRAWATHGGISARLQPRVPPIVEGTVLLVAAPSGPLEVLAPNRIVSVVDEAERFGFAYGTLPGHPERGEELFLAEQSAPGRLRLTVRIHASPGALIPRLAPPVVRLLQAAAARRYLAAWAVAIDHSLREDP